MNKAKQLFYSRNIYPSWWFCNGIKFKKYIFFNMTRNINVKTVFCPGYYFNRWEIKTKMEKVLFDGKDLKVRDISP